MIKILTLTIIFGLLSNYSFAYLGPGIGGGILLATVGVIVAILAAVFGLVWFPIKRLLNKRKEKKNTKID